MDNMPQKIKSINEYVPNKTNFKIRLDANESPFYADEEQLSGIRQEISNSLNRYPDPMAFELCEAFKKAYRIEKAEVAAGNGSDELISIICSTFISKGDKVLIVSPDFSMYEFYLNLAEAEIVKYVKNEDFEIDFTKLSEMACKNDFSLCIFSNPCNPTGRAYSREEILSFVESVSFPVVVDEAYMDFCPREFSVLWDCAEHENMIVLKTMSKIGFAALRIGFAIGEKTAISAIRKVKSPYNLSTLSQAAGTYILNNFHNIAIHIEYIKNETELLYSRLCGISNGKNFKVIPTEANFVTLRFESEKEAEKIFEGLKEAGISVRHIIGKCLRITCGLKEENQAFITEFEKLAK